MADLFNPTEFAPAPNSFCCTLGCPRHPKCCGDPGGSCRQSREGTRKEELRLEEINAGPAAARASLGWALRVGKGSAATGGTELAQKKQQDKIWESRAQRCVMLRAKERLRKG